MPKIEFDVKSRISEVLQAEAAAISALTVTDAFEQAVRTMLETKGKVLTTGIGKAGFIARKMAATLCSTATPAAFLHPAEAAHGDLGLVDERDCILAYSTSGKSIEVIETLKLSRQLGLKTVIGITSHPDSELRNLSEIILDMGEIKEPCPIGLTPTASIAVMLAISDALALALMELKEVSRSDYGLRHHGGYLGRAAREQHPGPA